MSIAQLLPIPYVGELFDALPETDVDDARRAIEAGDYIDASFSCPLGRSCAKALSRERSDEEDDEDDEEGTMSIAAVPGRLGDVTS